MISYNDYLKAILSHANAYTKEDFEKLVIPLFPALNDEDIDWYDFSYIDEDTISYIIDYGVFKDIDSIHVEYYDCDTKTVELDLFSVESLEDLEKAKKALAENGWTISNMGEVQDILLPQLKDNILDKIKDVATLEQLENFYKSLEQ